MNLRFRQRLRLGGCVAVLLLLAGCGQKPPGSAGNAAAIQPKQPVEVVAVQRRDLIDLLSVVGSLAANESAQIRPEIAGQVRAVLFNEGDRVSQGQLLMQIDDQELRAQLAQSEARFRLAELNLKRSANLTESKSMSQAEADRFSSEHAGALAELAVLKVRLGKTAIKAPFDGVIGARTVSPGDYVTAQSPVTTIDDLSRMKIEFQVPERYVAKVRAGTPFVVQSQSSGRGENLAGEVYFVAAVIDRATRSSQVKGFLTTPAPGLKPGMFANVDLVLEVRKGALTIPEGAILTTPGGTVVVAVKGSAGEKTADFVPVKTGLRARGYVEVEAAPGKLAEGSQVVASGVGALILFQGARLDPRPFREDTRLSE
ncbi:MAG: efflux RND transporter periplasmic adaptor subunit [Opitutae bacterium]|nr:efflux RND transporter periplasmic adaptor subunit [Opitutae bacterium]